MNQFFINNHNIHRFMLKLLSSRAIYALREETGNFYWDRYTTETVGLINIGKYRSITSIKQFFFPVQEFLSDIKSHPLAIVGPKSCDLHLLNTSDKIFLEGMFADDFYKHKRSDALIISSDCTDCKLSCFCTKMDITPYPQKNYDINLSPIKEGYVVDCVSNIGEELIRQSPNLFQKAIEQQLHEKEKNRKDLTEKVKKQNEKFKWEEPLMTVEKNMVSKLWKDEIAKSCVECDGCRYVCGSCYCFLLGETKDFYSKIRTWDSCQSAGYGRVAGGANPRKEKFQRLQNLYNCKMIYRKKNFGNYACSGCGRCIEVCPAKIDIRESLQRITNDE